jgi:tripartite-type tricarboxylate transporter receptor subunit TctC
MFRKEEPMNRMLTLLAVLAFSGAAVGQSWPSKPIRYLVPFAPGGTTDILARLVAPKLSDALGQPVIVENKAGAGGTLGSELLAKAPADGYTIGGGTISSHAINATLYSKLAYDPVRDFAPITMLATQPNLLIVHPSVGASSVAELIALLKANPSKYSFGSAGSGTSQHISGELFKAMTGVSMQHIPYKGSGQMIPDLLSGTVSMAFENFATAYPPVKAGRLKALAVTSAKRSPLVPDVPTLAESGLPGYDISSWQALFAPAGTPKEIVARIYSEVGRALRESEVRRKIQDLGADPGGMTPEELAALIKADIPRLGKIVRDSGAIVD